MLKKGYANRSKKDFSGTPFDHQVGDKVLLNTNMCSKSKLPKTIIPIWGALGVVERKRSAYTYVVSIISAGYNKNSRKKISAGKSVVMHVRYVQHMQQGFIQMFKA